MNDNSIPITSARTNREEEAQPTEVEPAAIADEPATRPAEPKSEAETGQVSIAIKQSKEQADPSNRELAAKSDYTPRYETPSRRSASLRPGSFNPLAWLADGVTGAIEEVRHNDLGLSQDFWMHLYATRREGLLTAKAFVESLIEKVESKAAQQEDRQQRRDRRGSVNIDF